jgi:hypothetical protein
MLTTRIGSRAQPKDQDKEALKAEMTRLEDAEKEVSIESPCCDKIGSPRFVG